MPLGIAARTGLCCAQQTLLNAGLEPKPHVSAAGALCGGVCRLGDSMSASAWSWEPYVRVCGAARSAPQRKLWVLASLGTRATGVAEDCGSLAAHYAVTPPQASRRVRCTCLPSHSCSFSFPAHLGSPSPFGAATKYARTPACTAPSASRICTLIMRERSHTPATTRHLHQRSTSIASQHLALPLPCRPRDASLCFLNLENLI